MASKNLLRRDFIQRTTLGIAGLAAGVRPRRARAGQEPQEIEKVNKLVSDNKFVPSEWRQEVRNAVESIKSRSPQALNLVLKSLEADDERLNAAGREAFLHTRAKLFGDVHELIKERGRGLSQRDLERIIKLASENAVYVGLIRQSTRVKEVNDFIKEHGVSEWVKHIANFGMLDQPFHNPFKTVYELAQKHKAYEKFTKLDDELLAFLDDLLRSKSGVQRQALKGGETKLDEYLESHNLNKELTLEEATQRASTKVGSLPYAIYHAQIAHLFGIPAGVTWAPEIHPGQIPRLNRQFAFYYTSPEGEFKPSNKWGFFQSLREGTHAGSVIWLNPPRHLQNSFSFPINVEFTPPKYLGDYAEPPAASTTVFHEPDQKKAFHVRALDITERMPQVLPKEKIGYVEIKSESKLLKGFALILMRQRSADAKVEVYEPVHRVELKGRSVKVPLGETAGREYRFVYLHPNGQERARDRRLFQILGGKTTPVTIADRLIPD